MADLGYDYVIGPVNSPRRAAFIQANFEKVRDFINVGLDSDNLAAAVAQVLGLSQTGTVRRGKSLVATSETRNNSTYGLMPTPDRVQGLVLPTDGWIVCGYRALYGVAGAGSGYVGLFLGANEVRVPAANGAPALAEIEIGGSTNTQVISTDSRAGLAYTVTTGTNSTYVTTGQILGVKDAGVGIGVGQRGGGGPVVIEATAGTYDLSVQFKNTSAGGISLSDRKLWAYTVGFG